MVLRVSNLMEVLFPLVDHRTRKERLQVTSCTRARHLFSITTKLSDLTWLESQASINPYTNAPWHADASMLYRRLEIYKYTKVPKPPARLKYCPRCFVNLLMAQACETLNCDTWLRVWCISVQMPFNLRIPVSCRKQFKNRTSFRYLPLYSAGETQWRSPHEYRRWKLNSKCGRIAIEKIKMKSTWIRNQIKLKSNWDTPS